MKSFTAISTLFLAAASTAAAQTTQAPHLLRLSPLSVKSLTESQTSRIDFGVEDLKNGAKTTCSTAWNNGELDASTWFECEDKAFTFNFPTGLDDIEAFDFLVGHSAPAPAGSVIGSAHLNSHAGTSVYVCKDGATAGVEKECNVSADSGVAVQPVNQ
ncbi:hypothetical protein BJX70DRAFT_398566 [Aspergillus crustosus]